MQSTLRTFFFSVISATNRYLHEKEIGSHRSIELQLEILTPREFIALTLRKITKYNSHFPFVGYNRISQNFNALKHNFYTYTLLLHRHTALTYYVRLSQYAAIISKQLSHWLVFGIEVHCVLCKAETAFYSNIRFQTA